MQSFRDVELRSVLSLRRAMIHRTDLEGTLARWFAVDASGHIGVFTGAYAAWPAAVFSDYSLVEAADELLSASPPVTDGVHTRRRRAEDRTRGGRLRGDTPADFALLEASQGLFSFDADLGYGGSTIYYLHAFPRVPLPVTDAHPTIKRAARLVTFDQIQFADVEALDLADHVAFVVGKG